MNEYTIIGSEERHVSKSEYQCWETTYLVTRFRVHSRRKISHWHHLRHSHSKNRRISDKQFHHPKRKKSICHTTDKPTCSIKSTYHSSSSTPNKTYHTKNSRCHTTKRTQKRSKRIRKTRFGDSNRIFSRKIR